jgi:hypothetical protein
MWFRRRRRSPPPVLLPSLDRLAELIEQVVALLDQVALPRAAAPTRASRQPAPREEVVLKQHNPGPAADGWIAFVPSPEGYGLLPQLGAPPQRGGVLQLDEGAFVVIRLGPSPLPGDRRRCAFLEQEPPPADRTFDP